MNRVDHAIRWQDVRNLSALGAHGTQALSLRLYTDVHVRRAIVAAMRVRGVKSN